MSKNKLYIGKLSADELVKKYGSPLYVYDSEKIKHQFNQLKNNISYKNTEFHYACKANTNLEVLKLLKKLGAQIECVSVGEVKAAYKAGFQAKDIIFTCSNLTVDELKFIVKNKIQINLDSLGQIEKYGELKPGGNISIRINQGIGAGHHSHVITGGPNSKFGIYFTQIKEAKKLAQKYNLKIIGIHQHIGSNVLDDKIFLKAFRILLKTAKQFENLEFIDFGGGFGIPYKPNERPLNMKTLGKAVSLEFTKFCKSYRKNLKMIFEAGRFLVAESGYLLTTVVDIKKTPFKTFVGVNSGFNHLIRPAMYDSYHEIVNATNLTGKKEIVTVAGNICESGDIFASNRKIAQCREGDVLAILNAGAYGFTMASEYNSRAKPKEIIIKKN